MPESSRRHLLLVTGAAGAGAACGPLPQAPPARDSAVREVMESPFLELDGGLPDPQALGWRSPGGGVDVGALAEYPAGTWRFNAGARAIVARDAQGFFAYTAVCSHEGCLVRAPDARGHTTCPCHGSRFDGNGAVLTGPAVSPLRHFAVRLLGGRIYVDVASRVAATARVLPEAPDAGVPDAGRMDGASDATGDTGPADTGPPDLGPADTGDPCMRGSDIGPVTMFMPGTFSLVLVRPMVGVVVGRDARGLFAFSATCTHSGCTVGRPDREGRTECGCHGSQYDGNGRVVRGPARDPLPHYQVNVCAGRVRVILGEFVEDSVRTPVP